MKDTRQYNKDKYKMWKIWEKEKMCGRYEVRCGRKEKRCERHETI